MILVLSLFMSITAWADIYRYVDKNGVWHFTNVKTDRRYTIFIRSSRKTPAEYIKEYGSIINQASKRFGIDAHFIRAIIKAESGFDHKATSSKGAQGLMQLMPGTANDMAVEDPFDPEENIFVSVMPEQKKFMKVTGKSPDELKQISEKDDPRVMVRHMMSTEYEQLGRDKINGIDVEGIECTGPGVMGGMFEDATARLWVEIGTDFPVRIEIEGIVAGGQMEMSMVIDDFQWNVELDPALFVPDIPSDYTSMEMNVPGVDEGTAINGLRLFAELTDGRYPDNLALLTLMKEITEELTKKYGIKIIEKQDEYTSTLTDILQAAIFYAQLVGKDAVYHGDRVTAENPELVLLRWKVSEGVYRVVFGDLSTGNFSVEELAELEAALPK